MFCTKCGTQLDEGSAFCTMCGAPVEGAQATDVAGQVGGAQVPPGASVFAQGATAVGAVPSQVPGEQGGFVPAPKKNGARTAGIAAAVAAVAVVAIVGVGFAAGWFGPAAEPEGDVPAEAPTAQEAPAAEEPEAVSADAASTSEDPEASEPRQPEPAAEPEVAGAEGAAAPASDAVAADSAQNYVLSPLEGDWVLARTLNEFGGCDEDEVAAREAAGEHSFLRLRPDGTFSLQMFVGPPRTGTWVPDGDDRIIVTFDNDLYAQPYPVQLEGDELVTGMQAENSWFKRGDIPAEALSE